jgi:hypothetical protein
MPNIFGKKTADFNKQLEAQAETTYHISNVTDANVISNINFLNRLRRE